MQNILFTVVVLFIVFPAFAQSKSAKKEKQTTDTTAIYHDRYSGTLPDNGHKAITALELDHKKYADDGFFTLSEKQNQGGHATKTTGEWTVLRGDAADENATVVELDAPGRILYFLRLRNGNLQKLDTSLRQIKPAANYLLHKDQHR